MAWPRKVTTVSWFARNKKQSVFREWWRSEISFSKGRALIYLGRLSSVFQMGSLRCDRTYLQKMKRLWEWREKLGRFFPINTGFFHNFRFSAIVVPTFWGSLLEVEHTSSSYTGIPVAGISDRSQWKRWQNISTKIYCIISTLLAAASDYIWHLAFWICFWRLKFDQDFWK